MLLKKIFNVTVLQLLLTASNIAFGVLLAFYFGASAEMDAYIVVSNFALTLNALFTVNQSKIMIPFLARYSNSPDYKDIVASIARINILFFSIFSVIVFLFSQWIAYGVAPGLAPYQNHLASNMLRIISTAILFLSFCSLVDGLLEYNSAFEKPVVLGLMRVVLSIVLLVVLVNGTGIYSATAATTISLFVISMAYIWIYGKNGYTFRTPFSIFNSYIKYYFQQLAPMIITSLLVWLIGFADVFIASFFDTGSISYVSYCRRMIHHATVIASVVCTIYYPLLSRLNNDRDEKEFIRNFLKGLETIVCVSVCITCFMVLFARPAISILFQRGSFTGHDTVMVSRLLRFYCLAFLCAPTGAYLAKVYYAKGRANLANVQSIISSVVNLVLNAILGFFFGISGIASAASIGMLTGNVLQLIYIRRIISSDAMYRAFKTIIGLLCTGVVAVVISFQAKNLGIQLYQVPSVYARFIYLVLQCILFSIVFTATAFIFRIEVVTENVTKIWLKTHDTVKRMRSLKPPF